MQTVEEVARRYGLDFVALFGSTARTGRGQDVDLAVMPLDPIRAKVNRIDLFNDLSQALAPARVDLAWLPNASWLLSWHVARDGRVLSESSPHRFRRFCAAAYLRQVDSGWWRRVGSEYLQRFLRGELGMDRDLVERKLLQMSSYLGELETVLQRAADGFERDLVLLRAAERDTELLVECATRINLEIGQSKGVPPSDYYSSFFALVPDILERAVAEQLGQVARLRNMLIHQYEDLEPQQIYDAAVTAAPLWRSYLKAVAASLV